MDRCRFAFNSKTSALGLAMTCIPSAPVTSHYISRSKVDVDVILCHEVNNAYSY